MATKAPNDGRPLVRATARPMSDESKTHIFVSSFFKYISGLEVLFNVKLWDFHPDLCFVEI